MSRRFDEVKRLDRVAETVLVLAGHTDVYVGVVPRPRIAVGGGRISWTRECRLGRLRQHQLGGCAAPAAARAEHGRRDWGVAELPRVLVLD